MSEQPFSEQLKASVEGLWNAAHRDHPFVRGLGDGSLPLANFQYYMRQDYLYLIDYCRVFAYAAAKAADVETMGRWAKLLDETLNSEMALHRSFCADFGVSEAELEATEPSATTISYTSHLLEVARNGTIEEIAAAVLPCQWGYDEIGRRLSDEMAAPEDSFHRRWVAGYTAPEYREVTKWLKGFVDRQGENASEATRQRMRDVFKESTRQEYLFWEAAWGRSG